MKICFYFFLFSFAWMSVQAKMIEIPAGEHTPFLSDGDGESRPVKLKPFLVDESPVTNAEFNRFVAKEKKWQKSKILDLFADENYLKHWEGDLLGAGEQKQIGNKPVIYVSWFAAKAYCKQQGKTLPSLNEWEYASDADNKEHIKAILKWYGTTNGGELASIEKMKPNKFGLKGMHAHIWEWVDDFNSVLITQDSRNSPTDKLEGLFCGGGSLRSKDSSDYASFMRHAFRSGLDGQYTYSLLGFRCAKDIERN